jgi:hypothetical protein
LGRHISVLGGILKRWGLTEIEHLIEERIGGWVRAIYPFGRVREIRQFVERMIAVAQWLKLGEAPRASTHIICSHTHEPAAANADPVHSFTSGLTGVAYGNTGAWSSRLRLNLSGETRAEWMEIDAFGRLQIQAVDTSATNIPRVRAPNSNHPQVHGKRPSPSERSVKMNLAPRLLTSTAEIFRPNDAIP